MTGVLLITGGRRGIGAAAAAFAADVAEEAEVVALFDAVEGCLGALTALVNSAGLSPGASRVADFEAAPLQRLMAVNVVGTLYQISLIMTLRDRAGDPSGHGAGHGAGQGPQKAPDRGLRIAPLAHQMTARLERDPHRPRRSGWAATSAPRAPGPRVEYIHRQAQLAQPARQPARQRPGLPHDPLRTQALLPQRFEQRRRIAGDLVPRPNLPVPVRHAKTGSGGLPGLRPRSAFTFLRNVQSDILSHGHSPFCA